MKRYATVFLKILLGIIAVGALAFMLWVPQVEGRNVNSDPITLYFNDSFLAYMYGASIPFFVGLYQAFKLVLQIEKRQLFSSASVKAIKTLKYCAAAMVGLILISEAYILITIRGTDDIAGGVMLGFIIILLSGIIAGIAQVVQNFLQKIVNLE